MSSKTKETHKHLSPPKKTRDDLPSSPTFQILSFQTVGSSESPGNEMRDLKVDVEPKIGGVSPQNHQF